MPRNKPAPTPAPADAPKAAIYARVSTAEQAETGYGLEVQTSRSAAYIIAKAWQLSETYIDPGISGTVRPEERPAMARLLQDAEAGAFSIVVFAALDRLARKTALVLEIVEDLTAAGIAVVSLRESFDTSTPTGAFTLTMFAALAQLERDTIRERTTAGRNARGAKDGERGGRIPYGYTRTPDGAIAIDALQAKTVRAVFEKRRAGLTLRQLAADLNADEITNSRGAATRWHASTVRALLANERAYRGGKRGPSAIRWPRILR